MEEDSCSYRDTCMKIKTLLFPKAGLLTRGMHVEVDVKRSMV